ncbi:helicase-related protein [Azospirillum melinis]
MSGPKPFQTRTINHVVYRLWEAADTTKRFLVADEVGLGKTIVARGVIQVLLDQFRAEGQRVDVLYICSNAAIAAQNLDKLVGSQDHGRAFASRLTLLPLRRDHPDEGGVNFISFTPATAFDLKGRGGLVKERALLHHYLEAKFRNLDGLSAALSLGVGVENWGAVLTDVRKRKPDAAIGREFRAAVTADTSLVAMIKRVAGLSAGPDGADTETRRAQIELAGRLRRLLAKTCLRLVAPKALVVLDEFQRFIQLLKEPEEGDIPNGPGELARLLFASPDADRRLLLLSATPYRMLTLDAEMQGTSHYDEFKELVAFLFGRPVPALEQDLFTYQQELRRGGERDEETLLAARDRIRDLLTQVIVRTERVASTEERDSMVRERALELEVTQEDLRRGVMLDQLARAVGSHDPVEFWKSVPYPLDFMRNYDLIGKIVKALGRNDPEVRELWERNAELRLDREAVRSYGLVDPGSLRLKALLDEALPNGLERLLWIPPSLPYLEPGGPFGSIRRATKPSKVTKTLVFSAWHAVPDAIAALVSHEAERRLMPQGVRRSQNAQEKFGEQAELLRFTAATRRRQGKGSEKPWDRAGRGMTPLALLYPCAALADVVDPLQAAIKAGKPVNPERLALQVQRKVKALLNPVLKRRGGRSDAVGGQEDDRWYWAAQVLLDDQSGSTGPWLDGEDPLGFLLGPDDAEDGALEAAPEERRAEAVVRVLRSGGIKLGPPPDDLVEVLAEVALGSPAVCVLRALRRTACRRTGKAGWRKARQDVLHRSAAYAARAFQTLYNRPEAIPAVRENLQKLPYWRCALRYGIEGNLQALLDEYLHMEADGLALLDQDPDRDAVAMAETLSDALRLQRSSISVPCLDPTDEGDDTLKFRGHVAMRFAETDGADGRTLRIDALRRGFNSPFRPFILATTAVGQEGLDFHPFCHAVAHWNLPHNPVDLEQREGRIHRYKGHVVRLNLADSLTLVALDGGDGEWSDPWTRLFEIAERRHEGGSGLDPFWIYENRTDPDRPKVRRILLNPPCSRDEAAWPILQRRLALYRLAFGQPRQEDLLTVLENQDLTPEEIDQWHISLAARNW